jgi:hypothetical protein
MNLEIEVNEVKNKRAQNTNQSIQIKILNELKFEVILMTCLILT